MVPDLVGYLDFLAGLECFVFHGSNRPDIEELKTDRESGDSRAFGNQEAVFATPDPHWAAFFAMADRSNARLLRNGSLAFSRQARTRWYQREVVVRDPGAPALTRGWVYVLPRDTFDPEPKFAGLVDTGQWVSRVPVKPLFSIGIRPEDYPLSQHVKVVEA